MSNLIGVSVQGCWRGHHPRSGLPGSPQLPAHGPEEPLRLLPAPRGLLVSGAAGRAVHPAAAREQEEAAATDAGRRGAVPTPPAGQEEEGQRAAAGDAQPRDLNDPERRGIDRVALQPGHLQMSCSCRGEKDGAVQRLKMDGDRMRSKLPVFPTQADGSAANILHLHLSVSCHLDVFECV